MLKKIITLIIVFYSLMSLYSQSKKFELEEISNISYYNNGTKDSLLTKVNIVLPKGLKKPPVLIWLGGGAWAYVDRHKQMDLSRKIAEKGIAVVSVGHRLSPALLPGRPKNKNGIQHPEHIKDVAKAFEWVFKNEMNLNYDVNNIFVGGYSCGGHLSALLAADNKYLKAVNLNTNLIKGIIPIAGAYDIPLYKKLLSEFDPNFISNHINPVFGNSKEMHIDASPITYAKNLTMPILLMSEGQTYIYNGDFESEIIKNGNANIQPITLYDQTHLSLWMELSNAKQSVNRDLITSFIFKHSTKSLSDWKNFTNDFTTTYTQFKFPLLAGSYIKNLEGIKSIEEIEKQEKFFLNIQNELLAYKADEFPQKDWLDYQIIKYETNLNLERVAIEKQWVKLKPDTITDKGIYHVPLGKKWYSYFLKRWVDTEATPNEIYNFGLTEIERVKSKIKTIQVKSGLDSVAFKKHINNKSFFFSDINEVQQSFEAIQKKIEEQTSVIFPFMDKVEAVKIAKGENPAMAIVPAFYNPYSKTFHYNYFDKPYNKRQIVWTYIHEGTPGHHYQMTLDNKLTRSKILKLFEYFGYIEGYAAYVEELGNELNAYKDIYDELGKWEWDLIRSVRVPMDIGLNYYGWSDKEALSFWQKHISGKDAIAKREINRMKNWPAQVITYKYGASKILKWKEEAEKQTDFNLKNFHRDILKNGSIPLSVLERIMKKKQYK